MYDCALHRDDIKFREGTELEMKGNRWEADGVSKARAQSAVQHRTIPEDLQFSVVLSSASTPSALKVSESSMRGYSRALKKQRGLIRLRVSHFAPVRGLPQQVNGMCGDEARFGKNNVSIGHAVQRWSLTYRRGVGECVAVTIRCEWHNDQLKRCKRRSIEGEASEAVLNQICAECHLSLLCTAERAKTWLINGQRSS